VTTDASQMTLDGFLLCFQPQPAPALAVGRDAKISDKFFGHSCSVTSKPTIAWLREFTVAGGLMSYGPNFPSLFRRAAEYVDKVLRGAKPSDLPVEQPTKFDLVLNLTTAEALGLNIPPTVRARADEVIE
jgi:ABC-type uncharacterized transport system substrate-binding protein